MWPAAGSARVMSSDETISFSVAVRDRPASAQEPAPHEEDGETGLDSSMARIDAINSLVAQLQIEKDTLQQDQVSLRSSIRMLEGALSAEAQAHRTTWLMLQQAHGERLSHSRSLMEDDDSSTATEATYLRACWGVGCWVALVFIPAGAPQGDPHWTPSLASHLPLNQLVFA